MTTINTQIPETLLRKIYRITERERITLDQFVAMALASQVTSWETGETFDERAKRGNWEKARQVVANAPDTVPDEADRL